MDAADLAACLTRALGLSFGVRPILRGIDLTADAGHGIAIVGANGCGKSTLVRILAGLAAPTAGAAFVFGEDSRRLSAASRRRIGLLTHQSFLYPNLTARENLEFHSRIRGIDRPREAAIAALGRVGMSSIADDRVRTVSRGMEQRLAIARATIADPDLLLLDEPFAALDRDGAAIVRDLIGDSLKRGAAVIVTAHTVDGLEALGLAPFELINGKLRSIPAESPQPAQSSQAGGLSLARRTTAGR
jgi:heme exporter protein A